MNSSPNILILHTDQQRFDSLGCTGSSSARTPNLDAFADEGQLFTRHLSSCPICQPSRASLLTGLYSPGHQLWTNGVALPRVDHAPSANDRYRPVRTEEGIRFVAPTLGDVFGTAGYRTAAFGKLHLTPFLERGSSKREAYSSWEGGSRQDDAQPYYGFDHYEPILGHGPDNYWKHGGAYGRYLHQRLPQLGESLHDAIRKTQTIPDLGDLYTSPIPHEHSDANWLAERVTHYIEDQPKDRPFCCFVGFPGPHHPFAPSCDIWPDFCEADVSEPAASSEARQQRALMAAFDAGDQLHRLPEPLAESARAIRRATDAMVYEIDRSVGRIIGHLKSNGLWENTIVVFTSDHGDFLGDFGLYRKTCLNAAQLLRVPLICHMPTHCQGALAEQADRFTSNTDLLPTLAGAAGVPLPSPVHGTDLTSVQPGDRPVFAYAYQNMNSDNDDRHLDNIAVFQGDDHYNFAPQADLEELFDLASDPDEVRDRAADPANRRRADELRNTAAQALLKHHSPGLGKIANY